MLFLWSYAFRPNDWRDEQAPFKDARDLVEAMAHAFVVELEKALRRGVLHGYRLTEGNISQDGTRSHLCAISGPNSSPAEERSGCRLR